MNLTDYRDITALLQRHGFRFSKSMGQNFLTAAWVPERIAAESGITKADGALEIGPGVGCLTAELAKTAGRVTAIELDGRLRDVLGETLGAYDNVSLVFADALRADLCAVCAETLGERPWKVCANLPYNVTTPLITAFLEAGCFESVTVMIQKEVAQRLCAAPGTGEYGAFSVLVQWYAEPKLLFDVPPHCFVPQPHVESLSGLFNWVGDKYMECGLSQHFWYVYMLLVLYPIIPPVQRLISMDKRHRGLDIALGVWAVYLVLFHSSPLSPFASIPCSGVIISYPKRRSFSILSCTMGL